MGKIYFFEGVDYSGKSTQIKYIKDRLEFAGKKVFVINEPGTGVIGESIRNVLLNPVIHDKEKMDYTTRRLLYSACFAQHIELIKNIKNDYDYILIDRYTPLSDLVYGYMQDKTSKKLDIANSIFNCYDMSDFKGNCSLFLFILSDKEMFIRENDKLSTKKNCIDLNDLLDKNTKRSLAKAYRDIANDIMVKHDFTKMWFNKSKYKPQLFLSKMLPMNVFILDADHNIKDMTEILWNHILGDNNEHF